jgi:site-specific DNA recombinase
MFEWVDDDGLSARSVLRRLNELKIRPRKGASAWSKSSVLRILRNEMYAGTWYYNKFQGCEPRNPAASPRYRRRSKCSVRRRPRNEWLPLTLPEAFTIVPRERWERAQRQLDQNIAFSPRNEKHSYLLKGLVRCGACGSRYVGDPCHGKFYYRCHARCKKLPSVYEAALDEAVKRAVKEIMVDPAVILQPLRQLDEAGVRERSLQQNSAAEIEREARRINSEEQRLLEAYRIGIISPTQLAEQLEGLKTRRAALDVQRSEAERKEVIASAETRGAVVDYCAEAAKNLESFSLEDWRQFIRTVVTGVVFRDAQITILGRIPIEGAESTGPSEQRFHRAVRLRQ